ncbi:hypothetical protein QB898_06365 [Ottowia sp. 10c7w1]|uniref:Uncharacterized protein n=1 Tax=Ottowia cancrivicina TaxID=3040346 RepID=A0AAW6RM30_9BURK|nr:hypothetical protein [Ottowia sp. 10c7w1]
MQAAPKPGAVAIQPGQDWQGRRAPESALSRLRADIEQSLEQLPPAGSPQAGQSAPHPAAACRN